MNPPSTLICPVCGQDFAYRKGKTYCSATCRKANHQKKDRQQTPANAANRRDIRIDQAQVFELAMRLAETLYTMPPGERLGYMEYLVQLARSGDQPRLRKILTMPKLVKPDPSDEHLFWRGERVYCTISQAANRYCLRFWGASVQDVVRGIAPEPPTGEVETTKEAAA